MDAEITMERFAKKKDIEIGEWADNEWEDKVSLFEEEIDNYLRACYENGKFDDFLSDLLTLRK